MVLGKKTKGLVVGEVESESRPIEQVEEYVEEAIPPGERFRHTHTLYLKAPSLDYRYALVSVAHDFPPYPCSAIFRPAPASGDTRPTDFSEVLDLAIQGRLAAPLTGTCLLHSETQFLEWLR